MVVRARSVGGNDSERAYDIPHGRKVAGIESWRRFLLFDIVSREAYEALSRVMIDDYVTMPCEPQPADI